MNDQRKVIFDQRIELMQDEHVAGTVSDMRHAVIDDLVGKHVPENAYPEQWDTPGLKEELTRVLGIDLPVDEWAKEEGIADEELIARIEKRADEHMASKVAQWGPDVIRYVEKSILLQTLDHLWREHLLMLEHLRQVIGLRGYGQRDPLNEYKSESFNLFEAMIQRLREGVTAQLMRVEIVQQPAERSRRTSPTWRRTTSIRPPARTTSRLPRWRPPSPAMATAPRATSIRRTPPRGARSAATIPAPAARARSTSTATAGSADRAAARRGSLPSNQSLPPALTPLGDDRLRGRACRSSPKSLSTTVKRSTGPKTRFSITSNGLKKSTTA